MFEWASLSNLLKASPTLALAAIASASGCVLFAPGGIVGILHLHGIRESHGFVAGLAFAGSLGALGLQLAVHLGGPLEEKRVAILRNRRIRKRLQKLTAEEQAILRPYVQRGTRCQNQDLRNGPVGVLTNAGILEKVAEVGFVWAWPFAMTEVAWDYLNEHPELVGLPRKDRPVVAKVEQKILPPPP